MVNNCIVSGDFNVDKSPFFDVDYLFIALRAKSIGEKVGVKLSCNNVLENDEVCGEVFAAEMDIRNCEILDEGAPNDIKLGGDKGVRMKYPGYGAMKRLDTGLEIDRKIDMVIQSIDFIYDKDGTYPARDQKIGRAHV